MTLCFYVLLRGHSVDSEPFQSAGFNFLRISKSFDKHADIFQFVTDASLIRPAVSKYDLFVYVALFTERCSEILPVQF